MKRRDFLKYTSLSGGWVLGQGIPLRGWTNEEKIKITILHTNDVHSRIDPFPMDGSRLQGLGGVSARASMIKSVRKTEPNVLLLDSGDIFQGTPYFNLYKGEIEMKTMTALGYDASTIGNHDFDGGLDLLKKQLQYASFPLVNSNYQFKDTPMEGVAKDYIVKNIDGVRIGIFGLGIELKGLVPDALAGNTVYQDPVTKGNQTSKYLKDEIKCDYIICLSHLGYQYKDQKISDRSIAPLLSHVDLILGGHTHTFLDKAFITKNKEGNPLVINQVGWGGTMLGRIDIEFERNKTKNKCKTCNNEWIMNG
ncbi:MAG: metallophosphatase [Saprospiraceae bacterium]|nr:metallophosphatase [Saprospiraceae bacterium]